MCRSKSSMKFGNMDNPRVMRGESWRNSHFEKILGPSDRILASEGSFPQINLKTKLKYMSSAMPLKLAFPFLETSSSMVVKRSGKPLRKTGMKSRWRDASREKEKRLRRSCLGSEGSRYGRTRYPPVKSVEGMKVPTKTFLFSTLEESKRTGKLTVSRRTTTLESEEMKGPGGMLALKTVE